MAVEFDPNFSFNQQLWYYYTSNRGKIRSRYNGLTRKFLAYNDGGRIHTPFCANRSLRL